MNICPCCGQSVDTSDIMLSLESNVIARGSRLLRLSPMEAEMMALLLQRHPNRVTIDHFWRAIYGRTEGPDSDMSLRTSICKLRKQIRPLGIEVESYYSRGVRLEGGYRLVIKPDIPPASNAQRPSSQIQAARAGRPDSARFEGERSPKSGTRLVSAAWTSAVRRPG
jgi:DNA-binding winged helix-turn-helix (wHTH) protein